MESKEPDNKFQDMAPGQSTQHKPGASSQDGATPTMGTGSGRGRGSRKKRILRTIGLSVGSLFLIAIAVFGWWAYRQWTDMKEMVESAGRISSMIEANMGALAPAWQAGQFSESSASLHLAMRAAGTGKSKLPVVPFSVGPGGLPRGIPEIVRNSQKMFKALSKYKDRPLVREFLNELNSDPEFKKAWEKHSTGNPIKLFLHINNMKNFTKMIEKYAARPEFAILMLEVMNDPELKPFFEGINPGITGRMAAGTGSRPSRNIGKPQSLPNGEGSRPSRNIGKPQSLPNGEDSPAQQGMPFAQGSVKPDNMTEDDFQTMILDPSQIQGNKSTSSISVRPAVVPPP